MWVALCAAALWFALLGYRDLVDPDEGRYAEIPREMVASGDWVTPRLNGYKYFEKPPLQYWATASSFALFGPSNASARLPLALIGFAGALWVWFVGGRLFGEPAGFYAFLILISTLFYAGLGHLLSLDLMVSVFLFGGVGALLLAQTRRGEPRAVRNWMLVGWLALALATLTKGLIGVVLPAGAVLFYTVWQRDWALWKHLHLGKGLSLFLLVTAPWFLLVSLRNPEFPEFFFIHEHFSRYATTLHRRDEPWWFFLPWLLLGVLPWVSVFLRALASPGFAWWSARPAGFDAARFLWVFAAFVLLFFSLGGSKLPPYILPLLPPLAVLAGRHAAAGGTLRGAVWVSLLLGALLCLAGWQIPLAQRDSVPLAYLLEARPWLFGAGTAFLLGAAAALWQHRSTRRALTLVSLSALLGFQALGWGFQALNHSRSGRALAQAVSPYLEQGAEVFSVDVFVHSVAFYLQRELTLVMYRGELAMGIEQEPERWVGDWQTFARRWSAAAQAVAVFDAKDFPRFRAKGLPMRVVYRDPRKVAVVKR